MKEESAHAVVIKEISEQWRITYPIPDSTFYISFIDPADYALNILCRILGNIPIPKEDLESVIAKLAKIRSSFKKSPSSREKALDNLISDLCRRI